MKGIEAKIFVKEGATPKFYKPRTVPFVLRNKVEQELSRLQELGVISPIQFSPWAAPIVPVIKSNGSVRICGDFKLTVNQVSHLESYPLPRADDLFSALSGGISFTKLDLTQAYLQLPLDEESKQYLTINTHKGLFRFNRLPFGVSSAPAIFQRAMDSLLQGLKGVCVYQDDILVTGHTIDEHFENLTNVLCKLQEAGLKLNKSKCTFLAPKVQYLGFIIDKNGLHPTADKVKAIANAPTPANVSQLRAFLGLLNYYGKFLPNLSSTLAPLYALLHKKAKWSWGAEQAKAFITAKSLLQSDAVLSHFDSTKRLVLECDASPYGIGAILSQVDSDGSEKPVAFSSRTLTPAEKRYSQLDKEALAVLFGVKKFHCYLYGRHFVVRSDHQPLFHLLNEAKSIPSMASARLQRWALTLSAYEYTFQYKSGKDLANADALSRLPLPNTTSSVKLPGELTQLVNYLSCTPITANEIRSWTDKDPTLSKVRRFVLSGWPSHNSDDNVTPYWSRRHELSVLDNCLLWGSRLVVPPPGRKFLLEQLHESHPGISRMKSLARGYLWWPSMDSDIEQYVKDCHTCQSQRPQPSLAPVHFWDIPQQPWNRLHLDFAGPFLGHMYLILVDAHSKWIDVVLMHTITSANTIEKLQSIFAIHGLPKTIVTDNGSTFTSTEFQQFLRINGIRHVTSAPYHPSTNGLAERAVQSFKSALKKITNGTIQSRISQFLFRYRLTPHSATGLSPAKVLLGRRPRSQLDLSFPDLAQKVTDHQPKSLPRNNRPVRSFSVGEKVFVRDFRSPHVKWIPGTIAKVTGPVSYLIELADGLVRRHVDAVRKRTSDIVVDDSSSTSDSASDFLFDFDVPSAISNPSASIDPTAAPVMPRRSTRPHRPPERYGDLVSH